MEGSKSNIELVYEVMAAYQRGDEETVQARIHPEAEIYGHPEIVNSGTYHGFDGFKRWSQEWDEAWDEISYEPREMIEVGESLLVVPVHITGRGVGSGVEIDSVFGWLWEWKEGRSTRFHVYPTVDIALEAARKLAEE
jgi:ketosteroid isomerase-like protein